MTMPSIDDLLPPFFDILADGEVHTHDEIENTLVARFHLTERERKELTPTGKHPRFRNYDAFCKSYATRARYTRKIGKEGLQLTPLGLDAVKHGTQHFTVEYFYSL